MVEKLTPFQLSCRKALAEPYRGTDPALHRLQQESAALLEQLRDQACDRVAFTPDHADCVCRRTNKAADEIERLQLWLSEALGHIDALCLADWSAGDNAESDRAQSFTRDIRGRYAPLRDR